VDDTTPVEEVDPGKKEAEPLAGFGFFDFYRD
jgi:hypothetical protein